MGNILIISLVIIIKTTLLKLHEKCSVYAAKLLFIYILYNMRYKHYLF